MPPALTLQTFPAIALPVRQVGPGLCLCIAVTCAAYILQTLELRLLGGTWLEALVLAILVGTIVRSSWSQAARWHPGIAFSAKFLLELAVVLLGCSVSAATLLACSPGLLAGIAAVVMLAIATSYLVGRTLALSPRMALLVACGNSICGNSAIAAVAPVIGADGDDVAASIGFTAVLGVGVVLCLPLLAKALGLSPFQSGALAGLTVYAVPQVLAATAPMGHAAVQSGTLVKLVRVVMLGPVCLLLSIMASNLRQGAEDTALRFSASHSATTARPAIHHLVPWFILGFLALAALRSLDLLPHGMLAPANTLSGILTVISMAALGLGVDVRVIAQAGARVSAAVVISLASLTLISLCLIHLLPIT